MKKLCKEHKYLKDQTDYFVPKQTVQEKSIQFDERQVVNSLLCI